MTFRLFSSSRPDESLMVREELYTAAVAGDMHALNSLGATYERDGDFLKAAAIYTIIDEFFTKKKLAKSPFSPHRKNQAILDCNVMRTLSLLHAEERERFDDLLESLSKEFRVAEPSGLDKEFVNGDAYARKSDSYRLERIHCWTPVVSIVLAYWVFAFLLGLVGVFPDSLGPSWRYFEGLDSVFGMWVFFFILISTPFQYPFMLAKWFGALAVVFLIHGWIAEIAPAVAALVK